MLHELTSPYTFRPSRFRFGKFLYNCIHCIEMQKVPLVFHISQMCMDLDGFWYTALQINTNHTGKSTALHVTYIPYSIWDIL